MKPKKYYSVRFVAYNMGEDNGWSTLRFLKQTDALQALKILRDEITGGIDALGGSPDKQAYENWRGRSVPTSYAVYLQTHGQTVFHQHQTGHTLAWHEILFEHQGAANRFAKLVRLQSDAPFIYDAEEDEFRPASRMNIKRRMVRGEAFELYAPLNPGLSLRFEPCPSGSGWHLWTNAQNKGGEDCFPIHKAAEFYPLLTELNLDQGGHWAWQE